MAEPFLDKELQRFFVFLLFFLNGFTESIFNDRVRIIVKLKAQILFYSVFKMYLPLPPGERFQCRLTKMSKNG